MANILIRNVPEWLHERLKRIAADNGKSLSAVAVEKLSDGLGPEPAAKDTTLGFVKLDYLGDIAPDEPCDWCETPYSAAGGAYLCFRGDGIISAVVCRTCATG